MGLALAAVSGLSFYLHVFTFISGAIRQQLTAFLEGFYDIIPKHLIAIFNEQELELLISGLPTIDIDDLQQNTDYHKYSKNSTQVRKTIELLLNGMF